MTRRGVAIRIRVNCCWLCHSLKTFLTVSAPGRRSRRFWPVVSILPDVKRRRNPVSRRILMSSSRNRHVLLLLLQLLLLLGWSTSLCRGTMLRRIITSSAHWSFIMCRAWLHAAQHRFPFTLLAQCSSLECGKPLFQAHQGRSTTAFVTNLFLKM